MSIEINGHSPSQTGATRSQATPPAAEQRQTAGSESPASGSGDQVSLTGTAALLQALDGRIQESSGIDTRRVQEIRQALAEGRYHIDPERVAEKMIAFERALNEAL